MNKTFSEGSEESTAATALLVGLFNFQLEFLKRVLLGDWENWVPGKRREGFWVKWVGEFTKEVQNEARFRDVEDDIVNKNGLPDFLYLLEWKSDREKERWIKDSASWENAPTLSYFPPLLPFFKIKQNFFAFGVRKSKFTFGLRLNLFAS